MLIPAGVAIALTLGGVGAQGGGGWLPKDAAQSLVKAFPTCFSENVEDQGRAAFGAFWCVRADFDGDGKRDFAVLGKEAKGSFILVVLYHARHGWKAITVNTWAPPGRPSGVELLPPGWPEEHPIISGPLPGLLVIARDAEGVDGTWAYQRGPNGWQGTPLHERGR